MFVFRYISVDSAHLSMASAKLGDLFAGHLRSNSFFTTFFADVEWMLISMNRVFSCSGNHALNCAI